MLLGFILLFLFIFFASLMYLNKLPALLALPVMAVFIAVFAGISWKDIATVVVSGGAVKLSAAIVTVLFGSMLSQFVSRTGIAENLIKKTAELSGDNPFVVSLVLTIMVAVLFTVLGGLGAVIMVASIVLPIMLSIGVPRKTAGCLFLLGLSLGGVFNLTNWQLYISVLGLGQGQIMKFSLILGAAFFLITLIFLAVELKREGTSVGWTVKLGDERKKQVRWPAMLTPVVPIMIVLGFSVYNMAARPSVPFDFPIITAMVLGMLWGFIFTYDGDSVNTLSRSVYEGISSVGPAVALIMGIGMVLNAVMHPAVTASIAPLLVNLLPSTPFYYVVFFAVLSPLTLYRGPLNIWGMGAGLIGLMVTAGTMPSGAIMAALMSVGQIQGVCDPTNTHNVWIANHLNINVQEILKRTAPYMWMLALAGLTAAAFIYF